MFSGQGNSEAILGNSIATEWRRVALAKDCYGTWNRTKIHSFKGCCPTFRRSRNDYLIVSTLNTFFRIFAIKQNPSGMNRWGAKIESTFGAGTRASGRSWICRSLEGSNGLVEYGVGNRTLPETRKNFVLLSRPAINQIIGPKE